MKTLNELWSEVVNHPDFVDGRIWGVDDVATHIESNVEDYLSEYDMEYTEESLTELSNQITRLCKHDFAKIIERWESSCYEYEGWSGQEIVENYFSKEMNLSETIS